MSAGQSVEFDGWIVDQIVASELVSGVQAPRVAGVTEPAVPTGFDGSSMTRVGRRLTRLGPGCPGGSR